MVRSGARYPLATLAYYGPTNTLATKLVLAIVGRDHEPSMLRTWFSSGDDIRNDRRVADEVQILLGQHRIKDTVSSPRIIGCPHEEGIDYPMGRTCPQCPFWAHLDRFTHEPIVVAPPTMTPAEIVSALAETRSEPPVEALASAEGHREALIGPLLDALDRGIANPEGASDWDTTLFAHALYLFAKWREPRAYGHVCRWLSLPEEQPFDLAGDVVTEHGARILAAVCDGDLEPIKALILNRQADEYGRAAGVIALGLLAAWAEVPRQSVLDLLAWLLREGLEREPHHAWDAVAGTVVDIEARELLPDIRLGYAQGFIDPQYISPGAVDDIEHSIPGASLRQTRERERPIDDVVEATAWWDCYTEAHRNRRVLQTPRASTKVGANELCPCGSGKKYKKCCRH